MVWNCEKASTSLRTMYDKKAGYCQELEPIAQYFRRKNRLEPVCYGYQHALYELYISAPKRRLRPLACFAHLSRNDPVKYFTSCSNDPT